MAAERDAEGDSPSQRGAFVISTWRVDEMDEIGHREGGIRPASLQCCCLDQLPNWPGFFAVHCLPPSLSQESRPPKYFFFPSFFFIFITFAP
ncbi:hypothetical protein VFPFJ_06027 [Purpureocillium lilacinum]|uniref:Uncharacterized protein n=1 Tax=Purpureocillium lilacinum TaxID=33203 RepID=A0A179HJM1_PURLI|nr:hypothetical protein VFPFJ_06027 [Purpureocillium lilacinum]OAQ89613.1 hypothetical protein VFPFJ_06027 [Purpureocillium lilacinum]